MAIIKAFKGLRPRKDIAHLVASKPYDVLSSEEAREEAKDNEYSFLHVIKPEIDLEDNIDLYDPRVYSKARDNFEKFQSENILIQDEDPFLYFYRQIMNGKSQMGIVACSSIDDYFNDIIKKHEFTRPKKEQDRITHMKTIGAHPGPVFLSYPAQEEIDKIVQAYAEGNDYEYDFTASDGVQHTLWVVRDRMTIELLESLFNDLVPFTYIADGHHRAASSAKVGQEARQRGDYTGEEDFNYFLTVLFPEDQISIIDYNRLVKDLNGLSKDEFLREVDSRFMLNKMDTTYKPDSLHEFGMYLDKQWYRLVAKEDMYDDNDPVAVLDISILSNHLLDPVLGIRDQRTDDRIDFVGGIRGMKELEKRVDSGEMAVAFAIYPVSMQQLMNIADSGQVMPPKSTWFEPKLRSGLIIHKF
ncbi:MAG: DUF1015 domain-containing protein [Bacteroidia bacterium]|nr:DUF1015 domain-containing protein [Bacteroidia bacterium]